MLISSRPLLLVGLLAWSTFACGGKSSNEQPDSSGGQSQGGATSGGSGPTPGGSSSGGSVNCKDYADADDSHIPVAIINDSSETLYLGQELVDCGVDPLYTVSDASGALIPPPTTCRLTCEGAMSTTDHGGCTNLCAYPPAIALAPGERRETEWLGTRMELVNLPAACYLRGHDAVVACDRTVAIEPGTFTFAASAGTKLDCSQTGGECDVCVRENSGGCVTPAALISGAIRQAEVKVELTPSNGLGPGNGDGAIQFVEIRFSEP